MVLHLVKIKAREILYGINLWKFSLLCKMVIMYMNFLQITSGYWNAYLTEDMLESGRSILIGLPSEYWT